MIFIPASKLKDSIEKNFFIEQVELYIKLVNAFCLKNNFKNDADENNINIQELKLIGVIENEDDISIYVLEDNKLVEMYNYTPGTESTLGNIYNGKVSDIVNGMQAAFVDIGIERNGFISVKDAMEKVDVTKETIDQDAKMSDILKAGQMILVQVKKEPVDEKGARLSTHITFPGKYVVLMPKTDIVTCSQKIESDEEKERLKGIVSSNLPEGFGAIIRTDAEKIEEKAIIEDLQTLVKEWKTIESKSLESTEIEILYNDHDIVERTIRDIIGQKTRKIYVNNQEIFKRVKSKLNDDRCIFDDTNDLVSKFDLENEINKVSSRKVYLNCGGHIVIDKTEALTAIDVNSGKYTGNKDLERTCLKVNLEAAKEIMKQIRLKDIGGIVIIDFIDMHVEEHKEKVLEIMRQESKKDRSKVDVKEFTRLNLVELTRKKMYV